MRVLRNGLPPREGPETVQRDARGLDTVRSAVRWSLCVLAIVAVVAGCGSSASKNAVPPVGPLAAELPPSPAGWPAYPRFSSRSCWTGPVGDAPMRAAPSFATASTGQPVGPAEIVRRLLARFGDRRFLHRIGLGPPPPSTLQHLRAWYAGARPPSDALWAYIAAPAATATLPAHATVLQSGVQMVAEWETELVQGALRDDFCAAGGRPLVGWSVSGPTKGVSDRGQALGQRFPNPSPRAFHGRVAAIGARYGFRVVSLRLLRPRQLAPLLVVVTGRDRKAFVHDLPAIMRLLDPIRSGHQQTGLTFEGFYLEALDAQGVFVRVDNAYRGEVMGGEWSWDRCVYPYAHSEPVGAKPCPG